MSEQGTWCDNVIIQALKDKRNTRIHITESNPLFAEINVTETIHVGHIDELHYVSTVPFNFVPMSIVTNTVMVMSESNSTVSKENNSKRKHNEYMREYRKKRKTDADKKKTNEYVRRYRKTRPDGLRQNYNAYMREYRASKASEQNNNYSCEGNDENPQKQPISLKDLISTFHRIVNNRPVYVCSCCDQLWYKHSVHSATKLSERNPNIVKYLLNKTSVDNIEWVCRSCTTYLCTNKALPCAIVNGIQFPPKPAFFILMS